MAFPSDWSYYREITLSHENSTLSNFQARVSLDANNFDFTDTETDGADLRFTETDLTLLDFSIVTHDKSGSEGIYDVKIPSLTASKTIRIYYGNSGASTDDDPANTYDFYSALDSLSGWSEWSEGSGVWSDAGSSVKYTATGDDGILYKAATLPTEYRATYESMHSSITRHPWGGLVISMEDVDNWIRPGYEHKATTNFQFRKSTAASTSNDSREMRTAAYAHWYDTEIIYRLNETRTISGSSFNYTDAIDDCQGLATDGTTIWSSDHDLLVAFNMSGTELDTTSTLPATVTGSYGGLGYYDDGADEWVYAIVLDLAASPDKTFVIKYDASDITATPTKVAEITSDFDTDRGGNSISHHAASDKWIVGETSASGSVDYTQHFIVYDSSWSKLVTIQSPNWVGFGAQDSTFKGDNLYVNMHDGRVAVYTFDSERNTLTPVNLVQQDAENKQGVAWDETNNRFYFHKNISDTEYDVEFVTFSDDTDRNIIYYLLNESESFVFETYETAPFTEAYIGVGAYRDQQFRNLRIRKFADSEPIVSDVGSETSVLEIPIAAYHYNHNLGQ